MTHINIDTDELSQKKLELRKQVSQLRDELCAEIDEAAKIEAARILEEKKEMFEAFIKLNNFCCGKEQNIRIVFRGFVLHWHDFYGTDDCGNRICVPSTFSFEMEPSDDRSVEIDGDLYVALEYNLFLFKTPLLPQIIEKMETIKQICEQQQAIDDAIPPQGKCAITIVMNNPHD